MTGLTLPYKGIKFTGAGFAQIAIVTLEFTDSAPGSIACGEGVVAK
ncbi:MAG TPA: hypothetical protein VKR61_03070 [Bryobacteraceae bacterium]|nr:hypothetical protein [Bryobacteraceae bacterium]